MTIRSFWRLLAAAGIGAAACAADTNQAGKDLKPGDPAPPFSLPGSDGQVHRLEDLKGRAVVLAWFPKAFTGG
jgi:peroxiredoxin Q/BCP